MCVHASGIRRGLWFTAPLPAHRVLGTASHFLECKSGIIECGECDQNTTLFLLLPSTGARGGSRCLLCHVQTSCGSSQALGPQLNLSPSLARQHPTEYHHNWADPSAAWLWVPCLKWLSHWPSWWPSDLSVLCTLGLLCYSTSFLVVLGCFLRPCYSWAVITPGSDTILLKPGCLYGR